MNTYFLTTQNQHIALFLEKIKVMLEYKEEDAYRIGAFDKATDAIKNFKGIITTGLQAQKEIYGVGKSIAVEIQSFLETGTSDRYLGLKNECMELSDYLDKWTVHYGVTPTLALQWFKSGLFENNNVENHIESPVHAKSFQWYNQWSQSFDLKEGKKIKDIISQTLLDHECTMKWDIVGELSRNQSQLNSISLIVEKTKELGLSDFLTSISDFIVDVLEQTENYFVGFIKGENQKNAHILHVFAYRKSAYPFGYCFRTSPPNFFFYMKKEAFKSGYILNEKSLIKKTGKQEKIKCKKEKDIFETLKLDYVSPSKREGWVYKK
jgi:DNA polymerase/3'-5' exonuclease PolX